MHNTGVAFVLRKHGMAAPDVQTSAAATQLETIRALHGAAIAAELVEVRASLK